MSAAWCLYWVGTGWGCIYLAMHGEMCEYECSVVQDRAGEVMAG